MYIRRKVFSKIGEKTFSTTEFKTQKEFAEKKESKKEKVAKAATIGGATVGLGAGAIGLGAKAGQGKLGEKVAEQVKKVYESKGVLSKKEASKAVDKLKGAEKFLEKVSKKAPKTAAAGVGTSLAGAVAYKALKKKSENKK